VDANGTRHHLLLDQEDWARCCEEVEISALTPTLLQGRTLGEAWKSSPPEESEIVCGNTNLCWDQENHQLILKPLLFQEVASPQDEAPSVEDRRGAQHDRYGNWYWIDPSRLKLRILSAGSQQVSDFWPLDDLICPPDPPPRGFQPIVNTPPPAAQPLVLSGLAITEENFLIVGVLEPAGLLVFDLHRGGQPEQLFWPAGIPFEPFDMSPRPGGGVWILDRQHRCYWALDRNFDVVPCEQALTQLAAEQVDLFQAQDGSLDADRGTAATYFPRGIALEDASPLTEFDPIAIEGLPDGTVLILNRGVPSQTDESNAAPDHGGFAEISRYRFGQRLGSPASTREMEKHIDFSRVQEHLRKPFSLIAHDFAYVPRHQKNEKSLAERVYVAEQGGNQVFAFGLSYGEHDLSLTPLAELHLPMRLFSGKALVASAASLPAVGMVWYDMRERWLPLTEQPRPRYRTEATLTTPVFDSRQPDCTWHRLLLDACIPPDCDVVIESRAANLREDLKFRGWQREYLYLRGDGSEQPFTANPFRSPRAMLEAQQTPLLPASRNATGAGTWELLFQRAKGRYLQLQLTIQGQGQRTPRLRALRAYYPRFSYLEHYLPATYRQDPDSASFLDRFLANLEGFYTAAEDKIAGVRLLFDVSGAPPEVLDWLSGWFGAALDPALDDYRRRLFIRFAMHLFQYRGTRYGLQMALRLALDECPSEAIFADPQRGCTQPGTLRIVENSPTCHHFSVLIPMPADAAPNTLKFQDRVGIAKRILDLEKPAHTTYHLKFFWALFQIGEARLGLDTQLEQGSSAPWLRSLVLGQAYLAESRLEAGYPYDLQGRLVLRRSGCDLPGSGDIVQSANATATTPTPRAPDSNDCWQRSRF